MNKRLIVQKQQNLQTRDKVQEPPTHLLSGCHECMFPTQITLFPFVL